MTSNYSSSSDTNLFGETKSEFNQTNKQPDFDWVKFPELSKDKQVEKLPSYLYSTEEDSATLDCPSHKHTLTKNVDPRRVNWRCDRIAGSKVCKSGIYNYNSKGVLGYFCK